MSEKRTVDRTAPPAAPTPEAPAELQQQTRKLTEVEKLKLFNVHLKDKVFQLEKASAEDSKTIAILQSEIMRLKGVAHENEAAAVYKELGLKRGEALELHEDGTLVVNPKAKKPQELFSKVKGGKPNGTAK
jgi:hypothetical protein